MKKITLALPISLAFLVAIFFQSMTAFAIDPAEVEKALHGAGAVGWIHGAVAERDLYVFTYRNPDDFFDYLELSLVPADETINSVLKTLDRHDQVRIKGSFLSNPSPQKHIEVTAIEIVKKFTPGTGAGDYDHEAKIPEELKSITEADFLVHAIAGDGHILVVEFKDAIVPVYVKNAALAQDLFRGDIVHLKFRLQSSPKTPTHVRLNETADNPVQIVESIRAIHGKPADIEGALIMFPKSPEIIFNVFAVQQILPNGLKRQFTLVNFESPGAFAKIRAKLQAAWDRHPGEFVNGRNKLVSTRIRVRATGTFNEIDPNQANPQVLLIDENSITLSE